MKRLMAVAAAALITACGGGLLPAAEQSPLPPRPELETVHIGTPALNVFNQLPLAIAIQLGYFSARGMTVETRDYSSGLAALTGLGKGEVDLISVPYEFTIQAQMGGAAIKAIALYQLRPGFVLGVGKQHFTEVQGIRDLVGHPVCVTALQTPTERLVRLIALRNGIDPQSIPLQTCGVSTAEYSTRIAAGAVWAAVQVDPPFSKLENDGWVTALYDTRSSTGAKAVYGGDGVYPTHVLAAPESFLRQYPNTALVLVQAIVEALRFIHSHTAAQIAAIMPAEYKQGQPEGYAASLAKNVGMFSPDGLMPANGPTTVLNVLESTLPGIGDSRIDLAATYDNSYARRANSA